MIRTEIYYDYQWITYKKHGELHRKNGPAIIWQEKCYNWFEHGQKHRKDAPATIWYDGQSYNSIRGNLC